MGAWIRSICDSAAHSQADLDNVEKKEAHPFGGIEVQMHANLFLKKC
jgi:hypothetical protein